MYLLYNFLTVTTGPIILYIGIYVGPCCGSLDLVWIQSSELWLDLAGEVVSVRVLDRQANASRSHSFPS